MKMIYGARKSLSDLKKGSSTALLLYRTCTRTFELNSYAIQLEMSKVATLAVMKLDRKNTRENKSLIHYFKKVVKIDLTSDRRENHTKICTRTERSSIITAQN
jgi:hypothetical protein